MPKGFIEARDIAHLFGGSASATPYVPTAADGITPAAGRTPLAPKPPTLESLFLALWKQYGYDIDPIPEFRFHPERKWRFDFAFELLPWIVSGSMIRVAVECDGGQKSSYGGGRHNTDADRDKCNTAASLGWRVFHFSRAQLEDEPRHCAELVRCALYKIGFPPWKLEGE